MLVPTTEQSKPTSPSNAVVRTRHAVQKLWRRGRRQLGRLTRRAGIYDEIVAVRNALQARREWLSKRKAAVAEWRERRKSTLHPAFNGVTVVIPTHRPNEYVGPAIKSVLRQDAPKKLVDVLVSVNGANIEYYKHLRRRYALHRRVRIIYTNRQGLSAGRNYALQHVDRDLMTYLDDDDYLTRSFLSEMMRIITPNVEMVCGRVDDERDGLRGHDTYINRALAACPPEGETSDYLKIASLLTTAWGKLYRTDLVKHRYGPFDEGVTHTEDVRFWADNFGKLTLPVACLSAVGKEAMVRRVTPQSMSRPGSDAAYRFWITERLRVIEYLESKVFDPALSVSHKRFLLIKIKAQATNLEKYFTSLQGAAREDARHEIVDARLAFVNASFLAGKRGIAFCHNFAPFSDASAYVAAKRLEQIADLVEQPVAWHIVSADMSRMRKRDSTFNMFYASYRYSQLTTIPGASYFNELAQHQWADKVTDQIAEQQSDIIYSRSMFAGSHEAAYRYKLKHPDVVWYAEFSDPIYLDTTGALRAAGRAYTGDEDWLNEYWRTVESYVYEAADHIIFTNPNQRDLMLSCADPQLVERARDRSEVLRHPRLDRRWADVIPADYDLDSDHINVGFFGTFYANRAAETLLPLLDNPRVFLHFFIPNFASVTVPAHDRIRVNEAVDHLRFLSIGKKLDYLVLNDVRYPGPTNPYIPSKLADYLATGATIIALVEDGSIMSALEDPQILKAKSIDDALLGRLR